MSFNSFIGVCLRETLDNSVSTTFIHHYIHLWMLGAHGDTNLAGDELGLFTPTVPNPSPILNVKSDVKLFDMDAYTGFMPSRVPLPRLPSEWETWEALLDDAVAAKLQVGDNIGATNEDTLRAEHWRSCVRSVSLNFQLPPQLPNLELCWHTYCPRV